MVNALASLMKYKRLGEFLLIALLCLIISICLQFVAFLGYEVFGTDREVRFSHGETISLGLVSHAPGFKGAGLKLSTSGFEPGDSLSISVGGQTELNIEPTAVTEAQYVNLEAITDRIGRSHFVLKAVLQRAKQKDETRTAGVEYESHPRLKDRLLVTAVIFGSLFLVVSLVLTAVLWIRRKWSRIEQKVAVAEANAERDPEKARYAWDVARANLELYFERNRLQVTQVFLIAIIVMIVGFCFVCFGVFLALHDKGTPAVVAGVSGVITQFIGATFMVIYRSTMTQANEFMTVLERINTVGMAVQVLDSIPEDEKQLKNETRAQIVSLLLGANATSTARKKAKTATQGQ